MAAKDEQKETAEQKPKAGKGKMIMLIVGSIVLTGILVGVVVFFLMHGKGESAENGEEGEATHEAAAKTPPAVYGMEPLIVNIHDGPELRYLKIKMEFQIKNAEAKGEIDPYRAPIQDALLVLLSGKQMEEITTTEGKNKLRSEVMASVNKIVPAGKVMGVYFTDFVIQ